MSDKPPSRSDELHEMLSQLGRCVQEAVTGSAEVNEVLDRIRERGYEPSFLVETSVTPGQGAGAENEGSVEMSVGVHRGPEPETAMTPLDKKFLRSLKISVE